MIHLINKKKTLFFTSILSERPIVAIQTFMNLLWSKFVRISSFRIMSRWEYSSISLYIARYSVAEIVFMWPNNIIFQNIALLMTQTLKIRSRTVNYSVVQSFLPSSITQFKVVIRSSFTVHVNKCSLTHKIIFTSKLLKRSFGRAPIASRVPL